MTLFHAGEINMNIALDPKLEGAIVAEAKRQGIDPEAVVANLLKKKFLELRQPSDARDDWERLVLAAGSDCGVSIPDSALTSDGLYD
jgi:hypothetical protein